MPDQHLSRRDWAKRSALGLAALGWVHRGAAEDENVPTVERPRATSGDTRVEPDWDEILTITVGPEKADLVGRDDRVLQAAVDYVARCGGGTVRILPGTYTLRNAVHLQSGVRLVGSGQESRLVKSASVETLLSEDSDWYDQEITLADASGFRVGDGVRLLAKNPHNGGVTIAKRTLVAQSGRRFKLDRALRENFWQMGEASCATLFPLLSGEGIHDVVLENVALDGNRTNNALLDGNYAGCVFLQDCERVAMRRLWAENYHGDGLSWQICHDVQVEECHSRGHSGLGLHPGSGSQRPVMRDNHCENNDIGLFFCWGVKYGLAEGNQLTGNRVGLSIGHRDTDNLIRENRIAHSTEVGILFRPERGEAFAPHRNRVIENHLLDNGDDSAAAIDLQGQVREVSLRGNRLEESRSPARRVGIRIGKEVGAVELIENQLAGFAVEVEDLRQ